jgi:hypothetical protein
MTEVFVDVRSWAPLPAAVLTVDDPEWVGYEFAMILEGPHIASLEVRRTADTAAPLNARRLQSVPLGRLERALRDEVNALVAEWNPLNPTNPIFTEDEWPSVDDSPRKNRDDAKLARLAQRYVETLGEPQQMERLGEWSREDPSRGLYTDASVSQMIRRARQRNLLTKTTKGRAGGELTPKALSLIGIDTRTAWERAAPKEKLAALRRERLRDQIKSDHEALLSAGEIDRHTYATRRWAAGIILGGMDPEKIDRPDSMLMADVRAATRYLTDNYKGLDQ